MPRMLVIRYDTPSFDIRMARVINTIMESNWGCDVIVPKIGYRSAPLNQESNVGWLSEAGIYQFPVAESRPTKLVRRIWGGGYFGTPEFRRYLAARLSRERYDAIFVRDSLCLRSVFRALALTGQGHVPVVCEVYEPRVEQVYDSLIRFGSWSRRLGAHARFLLPRLRADQRRWLPLCDHVFVVVEEMKSFLIADCRLDASRISVVHNVEPLEEFDQIEEKGVPPKNGDVLISFVGTLGPHRGIELLIDAISIVRSKTHVPFRLAIVGASPSEAARLQALVRARGVEHLINVVERVPHKLAMQWIKETNIGVIPHLDTMGVRRTIPFKLFQYMAAGAACVVSDVSPLARIIRETGCGVVFQSGNAEDLADKLKMTLDSPEDVQAMGAKGRSSAENKYSWEIEKQQYGHYLSLLVAPH